MITINGKSIETTKFPDGTSSSKFNVLDYAITYYASPNRYNIRWTYESEEECMTLYYLVSHIRANYMEATISLSLPYIPNARMDRVKNKDEVFTLKYFANFINSMNFNKVYVWDPHSNVAVSLLNNMSIENVIPGFIKKVNESIRENGITEEIIYCYPDENAARRYTDILKKDYVYCVNHRNWMTDEIINLTLTEPEKVKDKDVLIIDDICSNDNKFINIAKTLKEAGAKNIYLYITHCENDVINNDDLLNSNLINQVFTTDSIFKSKHDKITILK